MSLTTRSNASFATVANKMAAARRKRRKRAATSATDGSDDDDTELLEGPEHRIEGAGKVVDGVKDVLFDAGH